MIYLSAEDLLHIAERVLGVVEVRDVGLLESGAARPRATAYGGDAYPGLHEKVAALTHSIARNHSLVDGNKRLALAGALAFYGMNGFQLRMTNDQAYELIMGVARGDLDDVYAIAARLRPRVTPRSSGPILPPMPPAAEVS